MPAQARAQDLANFRAAVMDGAISAIITTDAEGHILDWNKSAERIFLYTREEAIGRFLAELLLATEPDLLDRLNANAYNDQTFLRQWELVTRSGQTINVEIGVRSFTSAEGPRLVTFVRDVSARVEAQHARTRALGRLLNAEAKERAQIATELHDDTIQVMAATLMKLDTCEIRIQELATRLQDAEMAEAFQDYEVMLVAAIFTLREAMNRTRRMMFELRPPTLKEHGLGVAVTNLAKEIDREVQTCTAVTIAVGRHPHVIEELAYRVILESMTNIRKHSKARTVSIDLREHHKALEGTIKDNGVGFDVASMLADDDHYLHLGLDSCSERIKLAGGRYFVASQPGAGTTVNFDIPIATGMSWESLYEAVQHAE